MHEPRGVSVCHPMCPRPVCGALCSVMAKRQISEHSRLPRSGSCPELVDAVPAMPVLERPHLPEALTPVRSSCAPYCSAGHKPGTPDAVGFLPCGSAGDAESGIVLERAKKHVEVLGPHRDVGIDVDNDVRQGVQVCDAGLDGSHDWGAALAGPFLEGVESGDPGMRGGDRTCDVRRPIPGTVLDNDPPARSTRLMSERVSQGGQELLFVSRGSDDCVTKRHGSNVRLRECLVELGQTYRFVSGLGLTIGEGIRP